MRLRASGRHGDGGEVTRFAAAGSPGPEPDAAVSESGEAPGRPSAPADNWAGRHPLLAALAAATGGLLLGLGLIWVSLPDVDDLSRGWPERTAYMRLRAEEAAKAGEELRIAYRPVPLSRIPATVQRAVLVSEDAAFYSHGGFDLHEIEGAIRKAWRERSVSRGASTITQQLARNLYLSPRRSLLRKAKEALIAWKLERELPKRRILELYLNVIEFGPGVFGVEAASLRYFGVGVAEIGPDEAVRLAATIPSPLRDNPATGTGRFRWRVGLVYRRAFGPEEEREEIIPPPDSLVIEVAPPGLPGGERPDLPAPDSAVTDTTVPDTAAADTTARDTTPAARAAPPEAATPPPDTTAPDTTALTRPGPSTA